MIEVFKQGGPIMWPLLLTSVVALGVILERLWFLSRRENRGSVSGLDELLSLAQQGRIEPVSYTHLKLPTSDLV